MPPIRRVLAATLLVVPGGCAPPAPVGLPNPSATFCIAQGGRYENRREPAGERGVCILPNGQEVDAWAFFRTRHPG